MTPQRQPSAHYYYLVDLVRFAAALMVLLFHLGYSTWQQRSGAYHLSGGLYSIPEGLQFWFGWVGVQIFFVISGFVIANSASNSSPVRFLKGRILRLYPAAWVCATITLAVTLLYGVYSAEQALPRYLASITLFPRGPWIEGVYWTLAVEIIFYALIFFLVFFKKFHRLEMFSTALGIYSGAFIVLVLGNRLELVQIAGIESFRTGLGVKILLWHGAFFSLGMYIWLWSVQRLSRAGMGFALVTVVLCCIQIYLGSTRFDDGAVDFTAAEQSLRDWKIPVGFFLAAVAVLPLSVIYRNASAGLPVWALRLCRTAGLATYPLYLVHFTAGVLIIRELVLLGISPLSAFVTACCALILVSVLTAKLAEPLIQRRLKTALDFTEARIVQLQKQPGSL